MEIGIEEGHVHFLVQGVPNLAVSRIVMIIKSITAKQIFKSFPRMRRNILWGGALWTSGFYTNTVGLYASKDTIAWYIRNQEKGEEYYKKIYESQPELDFGN